MLEYKRQILALASLIIGPYGILFYLELYY